MDRQLLILSYSFFIFLYEKAICCQDLYFHHHTILVCFSPVWQATYAVEIESILSCYLGIRSPASHPSPSLPPLPPPRHPSSFSPPIFLLVTPLPSRHPSPYPPPPLPFPSSATAPPLRHPSLQWWPSCAEENPFDSHRLDKTRTNRRPAEDCSEEL